MFDVSLHWIWMMTQCFVVVSARTNHWTVLQTQDMRLSVAPREVIALQSSIHCMVACQATSWCASANLSPEESTCQLLTEEVNDVTSLAFAEGWNYLSKQM